jgi:hypothetical protein
MLVACSDNVPPTVDALRLSNPTGQRGTEFFLTLVGVEDPDGNVYAGKVEIRAESSEETLTGEVWPSEARDQTRGDIIVGANIFGAAALGTWTIEATFEDEGGARAAPKSAEFGLLR